MPVACTTAAGYYHLVETKHGAFSVFSSNWWKKCENDPKHPGPYFSYTVDGLDPYWSAKPPKVVCSECWIKVMEARGA